MAAAFGRMQRDRIMKAKTEEIVMQEMNLATVYSNLRLIKQRLSDLETQHIQFINEMIRIQNWFVDHKLKIPEE